VLVEAGGAALLAAKSKPGGDPNARALTAEQTAVGRNKRDAAKLLGDAARSGTTAAASRAPFVTAGATAGESMRAETRLPDASGAKSAASPPADGLSMAQRMAKQRRERSAKRINVTPRVERANVDAAASTDATTNPWGVKLRSRAA
jgi:hypothetical protein